MQEMAVSVVMASKKTRGMINLYRLKRIRQQACSGSVTEINNMYGQTRQRMLDLRHKMRYFHHNNVT